VVIDISHYIKTQFGVRAVPRIYLYSENQVMYQIHCRHCNTFLFDSKIDQQNRFCNRSHAAKYNNSKRTQASRDRQKATINQTFINSKRKQKAKLKKVKPIKIIQTTIIDPNLYPKNNHKVIKYTADFLNKDKNTITYKDVEIFKNHLEYLLNEENLSPANIKEKLKIDYSDFGMFLKKCMKIEIKNLKSAIRNYNDQIGRTLTDEKEIYWKSCAFNFDVFQYPKIPGYELLFEHKWFHSVNNPNGLNRDHMISKEYGWRNNIDSSIISHPANCHIIFAKENFSKNTSCSITIEDLLERIKYWNDLDNTNIKINDDYKRLPKSKEHRENISKAGKDNKFYTNGVKTIRQHKDLPPPIGYRLGMTRKKVNQSNINNKAA
jgi:hypothetical protein